MKKLFTAALLALSSTVFAATLNPIQLLNPAGSSAGKAIISTGASSAPTWGNVSGSALTGIVPIANGGTNAASAATALTNLGGFPVIGGTLSGTLGVSTSSPSFTLIDTAQAGGAGRYRLIDTSGALFFQRNTAVAGDFSTNSTPLSFSASDVGAFSQRPTFNGATPWDSGNLVFATPPAIGGTTPAAGSFTTLAASSTVSGTGFSNYLASPPAIGGTTPNAGKFTTLTTTGMSRVKAGTTNAQSIPNNAFTTVTTWTTTQNQGANFVASTGVYTTPAAGDYDVRAGVRYTAVVGVVGTQILIAVAVNGTNIYQSGMPQQNTSAFASQAQGAWVVNCAAGDTITVRVFQNSGAAMTLDGGAGANFLQISQLP